MGRVKIRFFGVVAADVLISNLAACGFCFRQSTGDSQRRFREVQTNNHKSCWKFG